MYVFSCLPFIKTVRPLLISNYYDLFLHNAKSLPANILLDFFKCLDYVMTYTTYLFKASIVRIQTHCKNSFTYASVIFIFIEKMMNLNAFGFFWGSLTCTFVFTCYIQVHSLVNYFIMYYIYTCGTIITCPTCSTCTPSVRVSTCVRFTIR